MFFLFLEDLNQNEEIQKPFFYTSKAMQFHCVFKSAFLVFLKRIPSEMKNVSKFLYIAK